MKLQPGDYIALEGLTDQQVDAVIEEMKDAVIEEMKDAGGRFNDERYNNHEFILFDYKSNIFFVCDPVEFNGPNPTRQLTIEQVLGVQSDVVKQERYLGEDGKDLIDKWAERYSPEEFRLIMFSMMEKYQERLGKKDSIAKECRKIADYANRLALVEEAREK